MPKLPVINFEGVDGAGKTFALQNLKMFYANKGFPVTVVDSIPYHEFIQAHDKKWYSMDPTNTRYMQFLAYEVNSYYKNILPQLGKSIILIDRYLPSCFAYNSIELEYQSALLDIMNALCTRFFIPDATFVFEVPNDVLAMRFATLRQHENPPDFDFVDKVRKGYKFFEMNYGSRWNIHFINGNNDINEIVKEMDSIIQKIPTTPVEMLTK